MTSLNLEVERNGQRGKRERERERGSKGVLRGKIECRRTEEKRAGRGWTLSSSKIPSNATKQRNREGGVYIDPIASQSRNAERNI